MSCRWILVPLTRAFRIDLPGAGWNQSSIVLPDFASPRLIIERRTQGSEDPLHSVPVMSRVFCTSGATFDKWAATNSELSLHCHCRYAGEGLADARIEGVEATVVVDKPSDH